MSIEDTPVAVAEVKRDVGEAQPEIKAGPEAQGLESESLKVALEVKDQRIAELEAQASVLEQRAQDQEVRLREAEGRLVAAQEQLSQTVARYRNTLLASSGEVPEGLVHGETADEVDASFAQAKEVVRRIRERVEAKLARERVPAGAPTRTGVDLASLSSREKIAYALSRR
jgi:hypothetical protein